MAEAIVAVAASDKGASIYFIHGHNVTGCMVGAREEENLFVTWGYQRCVFAYVYIEPISMDGIFLVD